MRDAAEVLTADGWEEVHESAHEADLKWRRSWAGRRALRRKPWRNPAHPPHITRNNMRQQDRAEREAEAKRKRAAERGDGCPHVLTVWETVPHHRYPHAKHLAHRVPVGVPCRQAHEALWGDVPVHHAAGHRWA